MVKLLSKQSGLKYLTPLKPKFRPKSPERSVLNIKFQKRIKNI